MLILAADTSTQAASVAVGDENKLYGEIYTDIKLKHSERLMFLVDDLLRNIGMKIGDIGMFAVTVGPGSFTGIRIAMAAVKGLSQSAGKPIAGISSLECCALGSAPSEGECVWPILDAQRSDVYTARFENRDGRIIRTEEDRIMSIEELGEKVSSSPSKCVICGDAVFRFRDVLSSWENAVIAPAEKLLPRASSLIAPALEMSREGKLTDCMNIVPVYLRRSQAEADLEKKKC